jgi:1-acyl-sn-glycerol-3-phosphate acyltransferase
MRPVIEGRENVLRDGGLLVASNHLSYWDPPLLAHALERECHFVAKEELFRVPALGRLIRSLNAIPVRRGAADLKGIQEALAVLRSGGCLLIFPEGSRSRSGALQRARPGLGLLWSHARVPVLPVHLSGTNRDRHWVLRRETVRVRIGVPLSGADLLGAEAATESHPAYQRIADRVLSAIAGLSSRPEAPAAAPEPPAGEERSD